MSLPTDAKTPNDKDKPDDWNVEPLGRSTYDAEGRWTMVLKDLNTGKLTTWSEHIEESMSTDDERLIRNHMHRLDSMACFMYMERLPSWLREPARFVVLPFVFGWLVLGLGLFFAELYWTRWRTRNRGIVLE